MKNALETRSINNIDKNEENGTAPKDDGVSGVAKTKTRFYYFREPRGKVKSAFRNCADFSFFKFGGGEKSAAVARRGKKRRAADLDESKSAARTRSTNVKGGEPASIAR